MVRKQHPPYLIRRGKKVSNSKSDSLSCFSQEKQILNFSTTVSSQIKILQVITTYLPFVTTTPSLFFYSSLLLLFCLLLCIINLYPICHEIPHLLDTQKGRLCLFFIWTVGDGARCLAAAECSGVTVLVTGHDEQPQMKDEAWRIFGKRGTPRPAPRRIPPQTKRRQNFLLNHFLLESAPIS